MPKAKSPKTTKAAATASRSTPAAATAAGTTPAKGKGAGKTTQATMTAPSRASENENGNANDNPNTTPNTGKKGQAQPSAAAKKAVAQSLGPASASPARSTRSRVPLSSLPVAHNVSSATPSNLDNPPAQTGTVGTADKPISVADNDAPRDGTRSANPDPNPVGDIYVHELGLGFEFPPSPSLAHSDSHSESHTDSEIDTHSDSNSMTEHSTDYDSELDEPLDDETFYTYYHFYPNPDHGVTMRSITGPPKKRKTKGKGKAAAKKTGKSAAAGAGAAGGEGEGEGSGAPPAPKKTRNRQKPVPWRKDELIDLFEFVRDRHLTKTTWANAVRGRTANQSQSAWKQRLEPAIYEMLGAPPGYKPAKLQRYIVPAGWTGY